MAQLQVVMLSERAWERLELVAISEPVPLEEWLGFVREQEMRVVAEPHSLIEGGAYGGGHVLTLDNEEGRSRWAVPPGAIPLVREFMSEGEYEELLAHTPVLWGAE